MPKHLLCRHYEHSVIGRQALDTLHIGPAQHAQGLTHAGFLFAQMESAQTLDISLHAISDLPQRRSKALWRSRFAAVPGFCPVRLFAYEWVIPAICALGAYPDATDVARLCPYYRTDRPANSWGVFASSTRHGRCVFHVQGCDRPTSYNVQDRLKSLSGSLVGTGAPGAPCPSGPPPIAINSYSNPFGPSRGPAPQGSMPRGGRPRYFDGPAPPPPGAGSRPPRGRGQGSVVIPYQPYPTDPSHRRRGSPSAIAQVWKAATCDELDDAIDLLKNLLPNLPTAVSSPLWNDFLIWFQELKQSPGFSRSTLVLVVIGHFHSLYDPALAAARAAAESAPSDPIAALEAKSLELSRASTLVVQLESELANPPPGSDLDDLASQLTRAQDLVVALDEEVDAMEQEAVPPTDAGAEDDDPIAARRSFVPVPEPEVVVAPWPEANFEGFLERMAPLFSLPTGKLPLESLLVSMEEPSNLKILLPRPLELYTESEVNSAGPKSRAPWLNRHEDTLEPVKSWSLDTFRQVYSRDGFHFMIARTAQSGAQSRDPKLSTLHSCLSSRWDCEVKIAAMDPRQDWMLCTIPDVTGPRAEILLTALMRLSDGNASYIVRHFSSISRNRDLIIVIKGSRDDPNSVYNQLRKRLLEFEAKGVRLGWRVIGVWRTSVLGQYRASFLLDSPSVFWPWLFKFDHAHGSINPSSPLLNFEPPWIARKPYACQACYASDHSTNKCLLQSVRLGGVPIMSRMSVEMVSNRKAAERIIVVDRSLIPKKAPAPPDAMPPPPVPHACPDKGKSKAPLSPVPESPLPSLFVPRLDSFISFLALKLHHFISDDKVPLSEVRRVAACGSLFASLDMLEPVIPAVATWDRTAAASEFLAWDNLSRVPDSVALDGMSDVRSELHSVPSSPPALGRPMSPQPAVPGDPGVAPSEREPPPAPLVASACETSLLTCTSYPCLCFLTAHSAFGLAPILSSPAPAPPSAPSRQIETSLLHPSQETVPWLVEPKGFASLTTHSPTFSPLSPLPGRDWHKVNDLEPTVAKLHAAVSTIKSGAPASLATFVPPPPARTATAAEWKAAVSALAVPSPSVVPDSQPRSATPLVAPTPLSSASAPLTDWQPTPVAAGDAPGVPVLLDIDSDLSRSLQVLQAAHPTARDDFLLAILEKENVNAAATLGWLSTIQEISALTLAMKEAFPSAPELRISRLVQSFGGDVSSVWAVLSESYDSPWTSAFSAMAIQSKVSWTAMLPGSDDDSDVLVTSDSLKSFHQDWWLTYVTSRRYRLGPTLT